jgi:post-segregation antitoxin (ccd killing protein)
MGLRRQTYLYTTTERKNVTIREDQSEWVDEAGINLSQLIQEAIDDRMEPTEIELAEAYQENATHAAETNTEWSGVSTEANEQLGNHPDRE